MKVITLDKEIFNKALDFCTKSLSFEEILKLLNENDDVAKQIAILQIKEITNLSHAEILANHLTGQDGPIREACALKIKELILEKNCNYLDNINFYSTYTKAVCDVNPNISRFVIEFLPVLSNQNAIYDTLLAETEHIFYRIENPDTKQKNFLTVRLFNLYWCFEAIGTLIITNNRMFEENKLSLLLEKALTFNDYTINEKIAKIITAKPCSNMFSSIKKELIQSNNFYIKRYFEA